MSGARTDWRTAPTTTNRQDTEPGEHICLCLCEFFEYMLYWQYPLISIGVLVPAAIALAAISGVEEYIENNNDTMVLDESYYDSRVAIGSFSGESLNTFDAGSARGAAAWSLFISSIAILSPIAVGIACYYSVFENHYVRYSIVASTFCFFIGISLLAGGIANTVLYVDNNKLWSDKCSSLADDISVDICDDLSSVSTSEIACGVISFVSSLMFITLSCIVAYNGCHNHEKKSLPSRGVPSHGQADTPSRESVQTSTAQRMEPITPSLVQPSAPPSVQPSTPLSVEPSAPPIASMAASEPTNPSTNELPPAVSEHDSNAPPSYESTLTELPSYETALTDTNPVD